ncbi:DUF2922 domain-containing protein [Desulfosporosinus meridiei]|uniref:DUF2922 domain-containing protein n=1 Tax=Desulfosporosinus meridiei (strain ATCC BAA-275 / DSM 13257 / KCTC 12902 / NCIMB 13706 / S10) TaxID=768704 RepID=J7IZT7_DESMD|nr:DUF2922 domain-containing protein [Desulfosporosinus meridiei]AFQ44226.1 Protein of unknown function (DUF2922) [Desulfosporosinus meridiei DSM 13257]
MAVTSNKVIRLTFTTVGGKNFSITLPNPRADLSKAEAEAVMDTIITKNIFITTGGELAKKRDIRVIDTSTNDLYDPPQV